MDERREEREELAEIEAETVDEAREQEAEHRYWLDACGPTSETRHD